MGPSTVVPQTDGLAGHWKGVIVRDSAETPFLLDLERQNENWVGSFDFPEQRVLQYPLGKVSFAPPNVTIAGLGTASRWKGRLPGIRRSESSRTRPARPPFA
jgi:hypothetical protein